MDTDSRLVDRVSMPSTLLSMNWTWWRSCLSVSRIFSLIGNDVETLKGWIEPYVCFHFNPWSMLNACSVSPVQWTGNSSASGRIIFWLLQTLLMENHTLSIALSTGTHLVSNTHNTKNYFIPWTGLQAQYIHQHCFDIHFDALYCAWAMLHILLMSSCNMSHVLFSNVVLVKISTSI